MTPYRLLFALGAALIVLALWRGYEWGYGAADAKHKAELLAQIEAGRMLEDARRMAAQKRDDLSRKLEEAAHADPVVVERCLGPKRVRRLNAIR